MTQPTATKPVRTALVGLTLAQALALGGCSALSDLTSGDRIDYRSGAAKTNPLEVPPDLTPLAKDSRYLPQAGAISANALQQGAGKPSSPGQSVALNQSGDVRIERSGNQRWLVSNRTPEQLWPLVKQFWLDRGFTLGTETPEAGVMETDWAENRAKLPNDLIRNTLGRLIDSLYSTGERDKFRVRLERTKSGTEIYLSHKGLEEVLTGDRVRDGSTAWAQRAPDANLEAEMLTRLMISLGVREEAARTAVAATAPTAAKARVLAGDAAALQVDDTIERAWRRVGLALDRGGFTVEDRDRAQGTYFVRFVDAKEVAKDDGFFARLFSSKDAVNPLSRYRIVVTADGSNTRVSVQNSQGQPDNSANAQKIVALLVEELKL
ncbi:outer membrane protein assembly factor BamC [Ideonella sp.]|uniref:outer membrane protein assembly factor BamC n=1 Tax=Ideonella sp. TaxID=1929293 RepID=UPI0037BE51A8